MSEQGPFDAQRALRNVLGRFPTGVTVITALALPERKPIGLTVNSFSSVSLDPPLVLWSLSRRSPNLTQFPVGRGHVIHFLAEHQAQLAMQFATTRIDKFSGIDFEIDQDVDAPALDACVARFFCRTEAIVDGGDHLVIISRVLRFEQSERSPLVFYRGEFLNLGEPSAVDA